MGYRMPFDEWIRNVRFLLERKYGFTKIAAREIDTESWRENYYEEYGPEAAILEELSRD